jgi:23S rRNA (cytidine1920-2'-O)/16S rRNA (cytidine1409-2'-O)-methyltransferase
VRYVTPEQLGEPLDLSVVDVSFISLKWIFPTVSKIPKKNGDAFILIKPQFECEKKNIGKSGIVHTSAHGDIVKKVLGFALDCGLYPMAIVNAPVRKGKNIEYVLHCKNTYENARSVEQIIADVQTFLKAKENT